MISAIWGVLSGKNLPLRPQVRRNLIPLMFIFFLVGLGAVALASGVSR